MSSIGHPLLRQLQQLRFFGIMTATCNVIAPRELIKLHCIISSKWKTRLPHWSKILHFPKRALLSSSDIQWVKESAILHGHNTPIFVCNAIKAKNASKTKCTWTKLIEFHGSSYLHNCILFVTIKILEVLNFEIIHELFKVLWPKQITSYEYHHYYEL